MHVLQLGGTGGVHRAGIRQNHSMALFELTGQGGLDRVVPTSFAAEHVLERADLQRALRRHIGVIDDDILIVAEEFGDFADVNRRIDL